MHILMTFPYSIGTPGGGTYAFLQTARHLKAAGVSVTVMFLASGGLKLVNRKPVPRSRASLEAVNTLREADIQVFAVPVSRLSFALDGFYMRQSAAAFIKRNRVDVVISWHHEGAYLGEICSTHNIPFVCRASGNYKKIADDHRGRIWSAVTTHLLRRAMTRADAVWAPSAFTRSEAMEVFNLQPETVTVIPEGINPLFLTVKRRRIEDQPIARFLFFGLWTELKGLVDALAAFGMLAAQGRTDWRFHIAGWGSAEMIDQAVRENGIEGQVKVLGKLDHPELVQALEWAQAAVLPSKIESFGLALAEAQAAAVPVIAYNSGAVPEMITDGVTGWLAPVERVDLLAEAIIKAMDDPVRTYCMGLAGRDKIARRYAWSSTVEQMLGEIEKLRNA